MCCFTVHFSIATTEVLCSLWTVPVCVHGLLQLVIEDKLWVPEEHRRTEVVEQLQRAKYWPVNIHIFFGQFSRLPFVRFDIVSLHVLEVMCEVILQGGEHAAVFVQQLSGPRLSREPVHHCGELLLLNLLNIPTLSRTGQDGASPHGKPVHY